MFADSFEGGISGQSQLGQAALKGNKKDKTDMHSLTAKAAGVSRDKGKGGVFAMLYGCHIKKLSEQLSLPYETAKKMLEGFRGKENKVSGKMNGGIASSYFNFSINKSKLEKGLELFGQDLPECLKSSKVRKVGSPNQINYYIQALCSAYGGLSITLIAAMQEVDKAGLTKYVRNATQLHDEQWFMVKKGYEEQMALCLFRAHLKMWAAVTQALGIQDLPVSRILGECVIDVTEILRKEANYKIDAPCRKYDKMGWQYAFSMETGDMEKITY